MNKKYFSAVGKITTPPTVKDRIVEELKKYVTFGYILRSGGAKGADTIFAQTYMEMGGKVEIYLPWNGYNGKFLGHDYINQNCCIMVTPEAFNIAYELDEKWNERTEATKVLDARNVHIYCGFKIGKEPLSDFVVYFDDHPENKDSGTQRGLKVADKFKIPKINLYHYDIIQCQHCFKFIDESNRDYLNCPYCTNICGVTMDGLL